jgi:hypothetical protein
MADFVKYLLIDGVDEEATLGKYLKREQVVELRDFEGNPWEPATEIGTVTINPESSAVSVMGNVTFTAVVTGGDATDLTYKWTVRDGNAQIDTPDNQQSATYTFVAPGTSQIQCMVSSANSSNSPQSNVSFIIVS